MKKGWKIFWIVCACIGGFGIALCIAGTALGATWSEVGSTYGRDLHFRHGMIWSHNDWDNRYDWSDNPDDLDDEDWEDYEEPEDYDDKGGITASEAGDVSNFQGIRELDVELHYLKVTVREGSSDDVVVNADRIKDECRDHLVYGQEDGELTIEDNFSNSLWKELGRKDAGELIIELPKGRAMEDVSVKVGAGEIVIEKLQTGCLDLDVGAGTANVRQFETKDLNVDCGAGKAILHGNITRKAEIECGVGEIEMTLENSQEDYDYELKSGLGEIRIGRDSYTSLGNDRRIDNGTGKVIKIDCGIGETKVSFAKSM